jgi:DNA-binding HxlR family transcriptional regulator
MVEKKSSLNELEKEAIAEIIRNDKLKYLILKKLYDENRLIRTTDIFNDISSKIPEGKPQSYYVKVLRSLERSGLVVGVKPEIDKKNVYWKITDLGKEIIERIL